jgi:transcriptional regulator with XRE-family HTH domain
MKIAENLKKYRESCNLTQAQLAKAAGVTQSLIGHIERGIKIPSLAVTFDLADALGITVDELCRGV